MTHRNLSKANFLSPSKRVLKRAKQVAKSCNTFKDKYRKLSNKDLSNMTNVFIARIASGESLDDIMPEAFAAARETV
jgi:preprotein translocase subunit SecA